VVVKVADRIFLDAVIRCTCFLDLAVMLLLMLGFWGSFL